MSTIVTHRGLAGCGKTTAIVSRQHDFDGVFTYTNAAATILRARGWSGPCMTIYKATFPHVRNYVERAARRPNERAYSRRRISGAEDAALRRYVLDASGKYRRTASADISRRVHGWVNGDCPVNLESEEVLAMTDAKYALPLARWLQDGAPLSPDGPRFRKVLVDEVQDWSALELRALCAIAEHVEGYGDPFQAIFGSAKGVEPGQLPAAWRMTSSDNFLGRSRRVGAAAARAAAACVSEIDYIPVKDWAADHETEVLSWDPEIDRPKRGLLLSHARHKSEKAVATMGLSNVWVRPHQSARPAEELCLATIYDAKGMEADDVYVNSWSDIRTREAFAGDPEAMLVLYVAITRARRRVFLPLSLGMVVNWRLNAAASRCTNPND